jgi:molybdate transport system permease protein
LRPRGNAAAVALRVGAAIGAGALLLLIVLPLAALMLRVAPGELVAKLATPVVRDALVLSLVTTVWSTVIVVLIGLPVAYLLSRYEFAGKRFVEGLVDLPMVLPPTVAGLGLLLAFGRAGIAGHALAAFGISLPFTTVAVVIAQVFVGTPFFVSSSVAGFRAVEPRYLEAAAVHRATPSYAFLRVTLPLALPSVIAGVAMSWARSLGEFGATITFAGALQGRTQTMPIAVYIALQNDLDAAVALAVVLVVVSFALLLALRSLYPHAPRVAR